MGGIIYHLDRKNVSTGHTDSENGHLKRFSPMELITVGTGSSGNCYLIRRDSGRFIALDAGVPWKKVMIASGFKPTAIDLALITHGHTDHCYYQKDFDRNCIQTFSPENLEARKARIINGVYIVPFEVPHDTTNYAYMICVDGRTIVYMTDFGYCRYTLRSWNVDTFIVACNYVETPDRDEVKYDHVVTGHSSLKTVKELLEANRTDALRNVIIVHYSEEADTECMKTEIQSIVGDGVNVTVAKKGQTIEI